MAGQPQLVAAGVLPIAGLDGGITTVAELSLQHPFSALLAGGITALSVRQIWQNLNRESAHFDADEFALRRAQFRGYTRQEAAQHLADAIEQVLKLDPTVRDSGEASILTALRLQRLRTIARNLASTPQRKRLRPVALG